MEYKSGKSSPWKYRVAEVVFLLFEMIARKPVPQKYEAIVHGVGFIILMGFVALVTLKDIIGFF